MTRVLAVDDERDYQTIIREILKREGIEVQSAGDGEEALARLKQSPADVVLLDWNMPRMDGESFCRAVRADARFKGLPIIMLTVKDGAEAELEALHFGVDAFLTKPFTPPELLSRISAVLRRTAKG